MTPYHLIFERLCCLALETNVWKHPCFPWAFRTQVHSVGTHSSWNKSVFHRDHVLSLGSRPWVWANLLISSSLGISRPKMCQFLNRFWELMIISDNYTPQRSFAEHDSETEEFDQQAVTYAENRGRKLSSVGNRENRGRYRCHPHVTLDGMAQALAFGTILEPLLISTVVL